MLMLVSAALFQTLQPVPHIERLSLDAQARLVACDVDPQRFRALMELDPQGFDQDFSGGWRPVGDQPGCERAAADLLIAYMEQSPNYDPDQPGVIGWHAGQMLAFAGETEQAIAYFDAARSGSPEWTLYVDATLAFLRGDRDAILAARDALLAFAPDAEEQAARERFLAENPHITMPDGFVTDPPNLPVVDRLIACWGEDYSAAYTGCPAATPNVPEPDALTVSPLSCSFLKDRIDRFVSPSGANGHRMAVSSSWLSTRADRDQTIAVLRQEGRERGPGAPFGMAYDDDFDRAISGMTEADHDAFHTALTTEGAIACEGLDISAAPFEADIIGLQRWAEAQMMNPDPDAPPAVETLSLSRPIVFDGGNRVLVTEAYSFTPIPISRPPSGLIVYTVYVREGSGWTREAGIILNRMG